MKWRRLSYSTGDRSPARSLKVTVAPVLDEEQWAGLPQSGAGDTQRVDFVTLPRAQFRLSFS
jgi:hypothetical protein